MLMGKFIIVATVGMSSLAFSDTNAHYARQNSPGDEFIGAILDGYTGINDCAFGFRLLNLTEYMDVEEVEVKMWQEPHPLDDGAVVHLTQWQDAGVRVVALTFFTKFGPKTRLRSVSVTGSISKLEQDFDLESNITDILNALDLPKIVADNKGYYSDKGYLSFDIGSNGAVEGVTVECVVP